MYIETLSAYIFFFGPCHLINFSATIKAIQLQGNHSKLFMNNLWLIYVSIFTFLFSPIRDLFINSTNDYTKEIKIKVEKQQL